MKKVTLGFIVGFVVSTWLALKAVIFGVVLVSEALGEEVKTELKTVAKDTFVNTGHNFITRLVYGDEPVTPRRPEAHRSPHNYSHR